MASHDAPLSPEQRRQLIKLLAMNPDALSKLRTSPDVDPTPRVLGEFAAELILVGVETLELDDRVAALERRASDQAFDECSCHLAVDHRGKDTEVSARHFHELLLDLDGPGHMAAMAELLGDLTQIGDWEALDEDLATFFAEHRWTDQAAAWTLAGELVVVDSSARTRSAAAAREQQRVQTSHRDGKIVGEGEGR